MGVGTLPAATFHAFRCSFAIPWLLLALAGTSPRASVRGQAAPQRPEFSRVAERLRELRAVGDEEDPALEEKALATLDSMVLPSLNSANDPNLNDLNQRLAALVTQPPGSGESFRVRKLGGRPAVYVLIANFGLAGPSAVRLYAGPSGRVILAGRIDRAAQKDFFDEYLELVPVATPADSPASVFVTVAGRTDDLQTGVYTAWSFEDSRLRAVWSSDLLQQSSYEGSQDGFRLTYCSETDEKDPQVCRRMTRDRYVWDGSTWKRVEQTPVPLPKR